MANYNLTSQQIKDTYEQLVQVSGSVLVDGTGSLLTLDYVSDSTFTLYSGSVSNRLTTDESNISSLTSATSSYVTNSQTSSMTVESASFATTASFALNVTDPTWDSITGKPSGLVSSSAQIATDISGAFTSTSASLAADISTKLDTSTFTSYSSSVSTRFTTNEGDIASNTSLISSTSASLAADIATKLDTSVYTSNSSSVSSRLTTNEGDISTQTSRVDSLVSATSSYAVKAENNTFSGLQTFNNIAVNGTASIGYLQSVTGSAKVIGDAYIILNNDTPAQRYAGVVVQDSGSTQNTASFEFDGQTNDWFYEYTDDGGATQEFGVVMFGPGYNTRGSHVYPSNNTILKGTGDHHIVDSIITDDGSTVTVGGDIEGNVVTANTYFAGDLIGTASLADTASYVSAGSVDGKVATATLADTASYVSAGNVDGTVANATSASYAVSASYAPSTPAGLISGTGADSLESSPSLTTTPADASAARGIALGNDTSTDGTDSVHIGSSVNPRSGQVTAETVAIGYNISGVGYSVQVGSNITNNGTGGVVAIGRGITINDDYGVAIGENAEAGTGVAMGHNASVGSFNGVAVGNGASNGNNYATALGESARANSDASIAIGAQVLVQSNQAIAIGTEADVFGSSVGAIALGQGTQVTGDKAIAIGQGSSVTADRGIAIGSGSNVSIANGINIGNIFEYNGASSASIKDNLTVNGQINTPTFAGSITSDTSSINFDNGNFATLNCASSTFVANPSNIKSGTTYTVILTNGANVSGYGTNWKFAGGVEPSLSVGTDVLTCVSDGTNLYATALANFS